MAHRKSTQRSVDRKIYTQSARATKKINVSPRMTRGGIRL